MSVRLRKIKDEDKAAVLYFTDGTKVSTERRFVSTASNTVYFETKGNVISCHGKQYMTVKRGDEHYAAWSVPIGMVAGVK